MKKFVSLGSAMMMGTVLAREKSAPKKDLGQKLKQGIEQICIQQRIVPYTNPVTGATYNVL